MTGGNDVLTWLHIGDLHITDAGEQNYRDLQRIVGLMQGLPAGQPRLRNTARRQRR